MLKVENTYVSVKYHCSYVHVIVAEIGLNQVYKNGANSGLLIEYFCTIDQ